jgi:hypothetical protein
VRVTFDLGGSQSDVDVKGGEVAGSLGFVDVSAEGVGPERRVRVWADVDNPGGQWRDGLSAKMSIELQAEAVPATAGAESPSVK